MPKKNKSANKIISPLHSQVQSTKIQMDQIVLCFYAPNPL